jgi:hypothetical protein
LPAFDQASACPDLVLDSGKSMQHSSGIGSVNRLWQKMAPTPNQGVGRQDNRGWFNSSNLACLM